MVLSHAAVWYPERYEKLAFITVGYNPPGPFDIDALNALGLQNAGYMSFSYWYFFNSYDAAAVISDSVRPPPFFATDPSFEFSSAHLPLLTLANSSRLFSTCSFRSSLRSGATTWGPWAPRGPG